MASKSDKAARHGHPPQQTSGTYKVRASGKAPQASREDDIQGLIDGQMVVGNVHDVCPSQSSALYRKRGDLVFDAEFESGNLGRVDQISEFEYDLFIRPDTCNQKFTVWFYFSVKNVRRGQDVLFNVVNPSKVKSMYQDGMAPVVWSTTRPHWVRLPGDMNFYYRCPDHNDHLVSSFVFRFDREADIYKFAYCFPYTFTDLQEYLWTLYPKHVNCRIEVLSQTVQQRRLQMLTICKPGCLDPQNQPQDEPLKTVFVTARVHPGETPSSFVCEGLINFLLSSDCLAEKLRENFVFHIVPMLNPDGVYMGNYRSSLLGFDLNRCWHVATPDRQPTIHAVRDYILKLERNGVQKLTYHLDLHAHTAALNAFVYGNHFGDAARDPMQTVYAYKMHERADDFSIEQSDFNALDYKEGTARRNIGKVIPHAMTYTVEVSCFGYRSQRTRTVIPYQPESYAELGANLARAIGDVFNLS